MRKDEPQKPATDKPTRPRPPKTPLTEKLGVLRPLHQPQVDFLRWLDARGRLATSGAWNPDDWVAEFRGFDMDALVAERQALAEYTAAMKTYWAAVDKWRAAKEGGR